MKTQNSGNALQTFDLMKLYLEHICMCHVEPIARSIICYYRTKLNTCHNNIFYSISFEYLH